MAHHQWGKLERLNLYDHSFQAFNKISADSILVPPVTCIYARADGEVWIGTDNHGLIVLQQDRQKTGRYSVADRANFYFPGEHIQSIFTDKNNRCWILTGNGIGFIDPATKGEGMRIHQPSSLASSFISYNGMDEDEDHTLWLGSFGHGLFIKTKNDASFASFTGFGEQTDLPDDLVIETVKADQSGRVWIGTYGKGVYVINKKDKTVQHFLTDKKKPFSLAYNDVLCMANDGKGGMWIGTDGGGVSYCHNALNNFFTYSNFNLPESISIEQVRSITTSPNGMIWAGTSSQGLVIIHPSDNETNQLHFRPFNKNTGNPNRIMSLFSDEDGDIWAGTQGNGLMILDPVSKKIKRWFHPEAAGALRIPDHTIWCIRSAEPGKVWAGTQNAGLCLISKTKGFLSQITSAANDSSSDHNVRAIARLNDSIFCIGYERKGISFLNLKNNRLTSLSNPVLDNVWTNSTTLKSILIKPPYLLVGTLGKGLIIYNMLTAKTWQVSQEQGLPNNTIYGILEDRAGYVWLSSNKGLYRFLLPSSFAGERLDFAVFDAEDGVQSNEFNTGAYYSDRQGNLYFGGIKGLTLFNPAYFTNTSQKTSVVITQATINNETYNGDTIISYKKTLRLAYHENSMSFNFAALDFLSGLRINYSYRLKGYDDNWINAGNRNYAAYTNLRPGNYLFEVAAGEHDHTRASVTSLYIVIIPPFWRTWWFITLLLMVVGLALYGLYRYRVNQLLQVQRVRSRIATDLHDDIGSTLTNISILSELSKKNIDNIPEARKFLDRISEKVNASGEALDDIVWSINKNNDTIEQTVARMRRYAAEIFEGTQIHYSLQSDEEIANRRLNMELRRDYYLLFKESINNIYKHARARNVDIRVWLERNRLRLLIKDDGIGFDVEQPTHRNGIKNMYTRTKKWNGELVIESTMGQGTVTTLSLNIV